MRSIRPAILLLCLQPFLSMTARAQPSVQFAELEEHLLNSEELSLFSQVIASGAVEASISGTLRMLPTGDISLLAEGSFAGQNINLFISSIGQSFTFGNRSNPQSAEPPPSLWEALVIGFTRMGILHNVANLTADTMPDHAQGGVSDWVEVTNIKRNDELFEFDIVVNDVPAGSATLSVTEKGFPSIRTQTVAFPSGEMKVVETYSNMAMSK